MSLKSLNIPESFASLKRPAYKLLEPSLYFPIKPMSIVSALLLLANSIKGSSTVKVATSCWTVVPLTVRFGTDKVSLDGLYLRFPWVKEALEPEFKEYMKQVVLNAEVLAKTIMDRGFDIVSGGTKNHLMLVSLVKQGLTGKAADAALHKANITVNKNSVPNDPQSPFVTSGIRLGTAAITTRGFREAETVILGNLICDVLDDIENESTLKSVKEKVLNLTSQYPVYAKSVALKAASAA